MRKRTGAYITFAVIVLVALLFDFSGRVSSEKVKIIKIPLKQYDAVTGIDMGKRNNNMKYTIEQLTKAVQENDINLVNKIIKSKSVDINGKDSEDKYPIETVLEMENCDMAKILLEAGADPYVITSDGRIIYDIVMKGDNKYLKEIFIKYEKDGAKINDNERYTIDQLTEAVLENDVNLVNKIIKSKSVDINGKNSDGKYPIEMILVMGNCDMAKILLEEGADPYVITSDGRTVYDIVMKGDNKYLKEIFREYKK